MVFRGCVLRENVLIGEGSTVGKNSSIANSSIGKNVTIGTSIIQNLFLELFILVLKLCVAFQVIMSLLTARTSGTIARSTTDVV